VVSVSKQIGGEGFDDIKEDEVIDLISQEKTGLSVEEVEEILNEPNPAEEPMKTSELTSEISSKSIVKIIKTIEDAIQEALDNDPMLTRSLKFKHDCDEALHCYQELYKDVLRRAKQTKLTQYFTKQ